MSLSGDINVWKNAHQLEDNSLPTLILRGHSGSINQIALVPGTNQLISSDANGRICKNHNIFNFLVFFFNFSLFILSGLGE